ncbi:MAG: helix-turn-helix domain-containing protein [Nitrospirota bacterium]
MRPLTLAEAAQFLRMSRSSLYQRKDIPRYRRPGSRVMLFDQDELEAWLKQGRIGGSDEEAVTVSARQEQEVDAGNQNGVIDIQAGRVYHRSTRYR